jgi:transcriptional regulator with PAS, ATPase and Fis domain
MARFEQTETRPSARGLHDARVVVLWDGGSVTRPLPAQGALVVGRGEDCDVRVDHFSVSRKHAVLHLGPELRIEDLGSSNGTRVDGARIARATPTPFAPSRIVEVGDAVLTVQGWAKNESPPMSSRGDRMAEVERLVALVAKGNITVLLGGVTGVGKEVTAEKIHRASPRAEKPFLRVNCAGFTETLLESELFGYERGAFTGAVTDKPGLLELADGGTLFFDEVAELSLVMQAKLLRVFENREVFRLGGRAPRPIDVRFLCATNRDLAAACAAQQFREDLYYRLNGVSIVLPPLRERRAEIRSLATAFLDRTKAELGKPSLLLTEAALLKLEGHAWPGNVRELRNTIERAGLTCPRSAIGPEDLALGPAVRPAMAAVKETSPPPSSTSDLRGDLAAIERQRIVDALEQHGGNQTRAARVLGISRRTLLHRMDAYALPRPRKDT